MKNNNSQNSKENQYDALIKKHNLTAKSLEIYQIIWIVSTVLFVFLGIITLFFSAVGIIFILLGIVYIRLAIFYKNARKYYVQNNDTTKLKTSSLKNQVKEIALSLEDLQTSEHERSLKELNNQGIETTLNTYDATASIQKLTDDMSGKEYGKNKENISTVEEKTDESSNNFINVDSYIKDLLLVPILKTGVKKPLLTCEELPKLRYSRISAKTQESSISDFIALDIETTGLSIRTNIIEVSAVKFINFEPVEAFSTLCYCKALPDNISIITGITKDMLLKQPHFFEILPSLQEYIAGYNIVGHNLDFDMSHLMIRGLIAPVSHEKYYDTLSIARSIISGPSYGQHYSLDRHSIENFKLDTLLKFFDIKRTVSHRSLSDAVSTGFLFHALYDTYLLREKYSMNGKL